MNGQYPWSEQGELLLLALELLIQQNGDRAKLAHAIEAEWVKHVPTMGVNQDNFGKRWTDKEVEYLKTVYYIMPIKDIAKKLDRMAGSVHTKLRALYRSGELVSRGKDVKLWTVKDENFLKENYRDMLVRDMAKKMNRSVDSVSNKLMTMHRRGALKKTYKQSA